MRVSIDSYGRHESWGGELSSSGAHVSSGSATHAEDETGAEDEKEFGAPTLARALNGYRARSVNELTLREGEPFSCWPDESGWRERAAHRREKKRLVDAWNALARREIILSFRENATRRGVRSRRRDSVRLLLSLWFGVERERERERRWTCWCQVVRNQARRVAGLRALHLR